jgi:hypothetical protein
MAAGMIECVPAIFMRRRRRWIYEHCQAGYADRDDYLVHGGLLLTVSRPD